MASPPPEGLPTYRLLTGPDDSEFCRRVSEALALGYRLYGSPSITFNGQSVVAAQAVIWPGAVSEIVASQIPEAELSATIDRMESRLFGGAPESALFAVYRDVTVRFERDLVASSRDVALAKASALMVFQALGGASAA